MDAPHCLASIADVEGDTRHGAAIKALLGPKSAGATSGFMGVATLRPGEAIREHYHPYSEEFLYTVSGALIATVDSVPKEIVAGQALFVPLGVRHRFHNETDTEAFIVFALAPLAPRPDLGHVSTEEDPASPKA